MTLLLQVSDPHFGSERPSVVEALLELSQQLRPEVLVLSGDLTQRARAAQFAAAAAFVRRTQVAKVLAIPGNHDIPLFNLAQRFADPYAGFRAAFGAELAPTLELSDSLIVGVKTTRRYRHVDGEISPAQREDVARRLQKAGDERVRIVVLHQPLAVPRQSEEHNVVHGARAAIHDWGRAGADVVLAGHIHLPFVLPLHESNRLDRPLWAVNAGTATSTRVRYDAGNSVNVLCIGPEPRSCRLEQWSYSEAASAFVEHASMSLV